MSLLSYTRLVELVQSGIIICGDLGQVNSSSIDITLGSKVLIEYCQDDDHPMRTVRLDKKDALSVRSYDLVKDGPLSLYPGEFILAQSAEFFNLPSNISAEYKLKSSMARIGLEHLNAGWCDAGWNGSVLTLELKNMTRNHCIQLHAGDKIGQMVFFEHAPVPEDKSYAARGSYNGNKEVAGVAVTTTIGRF